MFTSLLDKTCVFKPKVYTRTKYGTSTISYETSGNISVKGYLTTVSSSKKPYGKEVVEYTDKLFTDYIEGIDSQKYAVEIDSKTYEIKEIIIARENHHIEFLLDIIKDF